MDTEFLDAMVTNLRTRCIRMRTSMWKISFMRLGFWSWPHISLRPGKYVSMYWAYLGPFCIMVLRYHLPYTDDEEA